jgi:hypothetical protein
MKVIIFQDTDKTMPLAATDVAATRLSGSDTRARVTNKHLQPKPQISSKSDDASICMPGQHGPVSTAWP